MLWRKSAQTVTVLLVVLELSAGCGPAVPPPHTVDHPGPSIIDHPIPELEIPSLDVFEDAGCLRSGERFYCESDTPPGELGCNGIWWPSTLVGGLEPSYPIAICAEYRRPGLIHMTSIIFRDGGFELIASTEQLREIYAPIESETEALSYALVAIGHLSARAAYYSAYDFYGWYELHFSSYFTSTFSAEYLLYYVHVLEDSHMAEIENGYEVYLFEIDRRVCGSLPTYSKIVTVTADGQISDRRIKLFELPPEYEFCPGIVD